MENNNKSPRDESDELIEILNSFRDKKSGESEPEEIQEEPEAEPEVLSMSSHFSDSVDTEILTDTDLNPHFTASINVKELQKEKKQSRKTRFKKESDMPEQKGNRILRAFTNSSFLLKAVIYVAILLIISAYLSYYIIGIGNDVFALVKDSTSVKITVDNTMTEDKLTDLLVENGIINYGWVFKMYLKNRSDEYTFIPGEHEVSADMNYDQIIRLFTTITKTKTEVRIVIPEGFTVDEVIDLLVKNGIGTRDEYVDVINNYPFKHEFVQMLEEIGYSEDRFYRLEGYLFPDTYDFFLDDSEIKVINKMLNNFNTKFWGDFKREYKEIADSYKMTFDDIIVLASMIEKEAKFASDRLNISVVFHNRLKSSNMKKLESDATIQYILTTINQGERREDLTQSDLDNTNSYNTYQHEGLPPGAICNPSLDSISAALDATPENPKNCYNSIIRTPLYFVSNKAGVTYYSDTYNGHQQNITKVKKDNQDIANDNYQGTNPNENYD